MEASTVGLGRLLVIGAVFVSGSWYALTAWQQLRNVTVASAPWLRWTIALTRMLTPRPGRAQVDALRFNDVYIRSQARSALVGGILSVLGSVILAAGVLFWGW